MKQVFIISVWFFASISAYAQDTTIIAVGSAQVMVVKTCYTSCDSNITFINLHENENTSVQAAALFLANQGGTLITLAHGGLRNISYRLNKKTFAIDPNRMFTSLGRRQSLNGLSKYNVVGENAIKPLANHLLSKYILNKNLVIALHNNTDSAFSILRYTVQDQEGDNAEKVFINEAMDSDDFILTTDSSIFQRLQEQNINVILQSRSAKDDGSLSIYAQLQGIPYINVEAEHGHKDEQLKMLNSLINLLHDFSKGKVE